jgi:hypothetical protein
MHFANADRSLQPEIQYSFSRNSYPFATGRSLRSSPRGGTGKSANRRAFTASCHSADNGTEQTSTTSEFSGALVGSYSFASALNEIAGFEPIPPSLNTYSSDINRQFGTSLYFSLCAGFTNHKCRARAARNRHVAIDVKNVASNYPWISLSRASRF